MVRNLLSIVVLLQIACSVYAGDAIHSNEISLAYYQQDICWSAELDGCDIEGLELQFQREFETYIWSTSLGYFASRDLTAPNGHPMQQSITFSLGIGRYFPGFERGSATGEWSWLVALKTQADDDYQNKNANGGYELRTRWTPSIGLEAIKGSFELAYQRYQNCSHPDCHLQGDKKPVISNLELVLKLNYPLSREWSLGYALSHIAILSSSNKYNGRDPQELGQMILLTRQF